MKRLIIILTALAPLAVLRADDDRQRAASAPFNCILGTQAIGAQLLAQPSAQSEHVIVNHHRCQCFSGFHDALLQLFLWKNKYLSIKWFLGLFAGSSDNKY